MGSCIMPWNCLWKWIKNCSTTALKNTKTIEPSKEFSQMKLFIWFIVFCREKEEQKRREQAWQKLCTIAQRNPLCKIIDNEGFVIDRSQTSESLQNSGDNDSDTEDITTSLKEINKIEVGSFGFSAMHFDMGSLAVVCNTCSKIDNMMCLKIGKRWPASLDIWTLFCFINYACSDTGVAMYCISGVDLSGPCHLCHFHW